MVKKRKKLQNRFKNVYKEVEIVKIICIIM